MSVLVPGDLLIKLRQRQGSFSGSRAAGGGRGWQILREHWRELIESRRSTLHRVPQDTGQAHAEPRCVHPPRDSADRAMDKIISRLELESPRRAAGQTKSWARAKQAHAEVRAALGTAGWRQPPRTPAANAAPADPAAAAFFPEDWWRALSVEVLAELIVDSFSSSFCDATLDGAITLMEATEGWSVPAQPRLTHSASTPTLGRARTLRPLGRPQTMPPDVDPGTLDLRSPSGSSGHGMAGGSLSRSRTLGPAASQSHEPWSVRRYHACQRLEPFTKRIQKVTELQRPQRRTRREPTDASDQRKWVWPMTATNFPATWERTTQQRPLVSRTRTIDASSGDLPRSPAPPPQPTGPDGQPEGLLGIGRDGKTTFPYSLALHRAFIEAQPDPVLRAKAAKVAPLRLTEVY